ncbi:MAG TPA: hypothetical protein VG934_00660 [Candidatus Paceibacterota bacterium]|nr:hypothetical protein [Candidatus Paceibacterota bacterium]
MNGSNVNTILIVVILVLLVGAGVWWYETYGPGHAQPAQQQNGLNINVGSSNDSSQ